MPISPITLQRRQAELGRIRLGQKQATQSGKTRPAKLDRFRFTSVSESYIRDLANLYGGTAQPWDNGGIPSYEVITDTQSMPVIVVKNGLSQWMETWSGGGCIHRCDGQQQVDGTPCDPNDRNHVNAKPTTRLSVMLPELEAIGVWRLESHGWNAAAEIPAIAELAQYVGDLVPATLHLVERRAIKDGQTSRFVVPVLDLQIGAAKLREVVAAKSGLTELEAPGGTPALESGQREDTPRPTSADIDAATSVDQLRAMWKHADQAGQEHIKVRVAELQQKASPPPEVEPDEDGAYPAEVVDEAPSKEAVWTQVMAVAGELQMTLWDAEAAFTEFTGIAVHEADATAYQAFLAELQQRKAAA